MAHEIEHRADRQTDSFAFVGERNAIWHRLGQQMPEGASVEQWMRAANLDFEVDKVPLVAVSGGEGDNIAIDSHMGLRRKDNGRVISVVSPEWPLTQNVQAFEFAKPLIDAGFCAMNTAGNLFDGRRSFILLKTKEGFQLPGGDENEGFILVQISHEYGVPDLAVPTIVRVVCKNTMDFALQRVSQAQMEAGRFVHRAKTAFSVEKATALIEAYRGGLGAYAEQAKYLSTKRASIEQTRAYINKVFKLEELKAGTGEEIAKRREHNAKVVKTLLQTVDSQPGAHMSQGSWWANLNAVTFHEDHGRWIGKTEPVRIGGAANERKKFALKVALEMAS